MNDVLNSQGYTQAAWWNRIPVTAWVLLATIAIGCNLLIGYGAHRTNKLLFLVLPLAVWRWTASRPAASANMPRIMREIKKAHPHSG